MDKIRHEVEQLSLTIENKIKNNFLDKFIKTPVINKNKLTILSILLKNTTLSKDKQDAYIIATTLVQSALDTHDHVQITNQFDKDEVDVTSRQLTVLAGDYYSALYYYLLSEIDDIHMIQVLASAIKEINEYKMQLYYMEFDSFSNYMTVVHKIGTTLITHVATSFDQLFLGEMTNQLLQTLDLINKKQVLQSGSELEILNNWLEYSTSSTKQSVLNTIESMIQNNMSDIEIMLADQSIHNSVIQSQLNWLIKPIFGKTSVVGEG